MLTVSNVFLCICFLHVCVILFCFFISFPGNTFSNAWLISKKANLCHSVDETKPGVWGGWGYRGKHLAKECSEISGPTWVRTWYQATELFSHPNKITVDIFIGKIFQVVVSQPNWFYRETGSNGCPRQPYCNNGCYNRAITMYCHNDKPCLGNQICCHTSCCVASCTRPQYDLNGGWNGRNNGWNGNNNGWNGNNGGWNGNNNGWNGNNHGWGRKK